MTGCVDHAGALGPARDQGARGTCLAFAASTAHEHARRQRRTTAAALGPESLYWRCKEIDGDRHAGTYPRSAAEALEDHGQLDEALWPYDPDRDDSAAGYEPPAAAVATDALRRARMTDTDTRVGTICAHLAVGRLVVLGLELWPQFYEQHDGILSTPSVADLLGAGHAVTAVGFDDATAALLVRNSWGTCWGEDGHARLPYEALAIVARGAWIFADDLDDGP